MSGRSDCRKFAPNIFNKSKCTNCFRQKEEHSAEALESNRASRKVSKCGYLFVAPGWDFSNPLNRTKRWQRRWFVLYDDGELTYSLDEHPDTVPQASIDMTTVLEVSEADDVTGHPHSLAVTAPERVTFVKGTCREEARWWADVLSVFPRSKGRHKRNATFPGGQPTSLLQTNGVRGAGSSSVIGSSSSARPRYNSCHAGGWAGVSRAPPPQPQLEIVTVLSAVTSPPPMLDTKVYTDQPVSSASPPTRDKINGDEKARSRRRDANTACQHHDDGSAPLMRQYDEQLRDIAASLTRPRRRAAMPAAPRREQRREPPTRDDHHRITRQMPYVPVISCQTDNIALRGTPDGGSLSEILMNTEHSTQLQSNDTTDSNGISVVNEADCVDADGEETRVELPAERLLHARAGWLQRRGGGRDRPWSRHWFVLRGAALLYYRDPQAEHRGIMDGVIDLSGVSRITELPPPSAPGAGYAFETETWDNKLYVLSAVTAGIRFNWVSAIRKTAGLPEPSDLSNEDAFLIGKTLPLIGRQDSTDTSESSLTPTTPITPLTPMTPRSQMFSSDDEYRTASEGGRRDSMDWGDITQLPPSPILNRTPISRVKEKVRLRLSSHNQINILPSPQSDELPQSDIDEIDSVQELPIKECNDLHQELRENAKNEKSRYKRTYISLDKQSIEIEDLRKQLKIAMNDVAAAEKELNRLRKIKAESVLREKKIEELILTLQKTEDELQRRTEETQSLESLQQLYNQDKSIWEAKISETEKFLKDSKKHCEILNKQLTSGQETIKCLQKELSSLNDKLIKKVEENTELHLKVRDLEISIGEQNPSKQKRRSINSLSDLADIDLDVNLEMLARDKLIDEYKELRSRFLRAIQEIKAMKVELRESHGLYDELELTNHSIRKEMEQREKRDKSQIAIMAERIQDLTSKLTASDKQVRSLKHRLQKSESRDKRRSLSLKGNESFSLGREVEDKLVELENKISLLESNKSDAPYLNTPSKQPSPTKDKTRIKELTLEEKKLKRIAARLRRKSLDSATGSEPMKMLIRLSSLETKVCSALHERGELATSLESISQATSESPFSNESPDGSTIIGNSHKHLVDRLQSLENIVINSRNKVNQCLCQITNLRSSRLRRSPSPSLDKSHSIRSIEKSLVEISKTLQDCFDKCIVECGHDETGKINEDIKMAVEELESQFRIKFMEISKKKLSLLENGQLDHQKNLELCAEKLAYEAFMINKIHEAIGTKANSLFSKLIASEIDETSRLIDDLQLKIDEPNSEKSEESHKTLKDSLARILTRRIEYSSSFIESVKTGEFIARKSDLESLKQMHKRLTAAYDKFKMDKMTELVSSCVEGSTLQAAASSALCAAAASREAAKALRRATYPAIPASIIPGLTDLEPWWQSAHERLQHEANSVITELASRRHSRTRRGIDDGRQSLYQLADAIAYKALIDARMTAFEDANKSSMENTLLSETRILDRNGEPPPVSNFVDILEQEDFIHLLRQFSKECIAFVKNEQSHIDADLQNINGSIEEIEVKIFELYKNKDVEDSSRLFSDVDCKDKSVYTIIMDKCARLKHRVEVLANLPCKGCERLQDSFDRITAENARIESAMQQQSTSLAAARRARAQLQAQHEHERTQRERERAQYDKERIQHENERIQLREHARRLERRLSTLDAEYSQQLENLKTAYRDTLVTDLAGDSLRVRYQAEIEQLRALCEKGLLAMESSHRRIIQEMEETHKAERDQLRLDKEQALAEETRATLAALDAMRKAHESEVRREVDKFKADFLVRFSPAKSPYPDRSEHTSGHQQEMEEIKCEILSLSEKYSIKCVESASLEEKLSGATQQLQQAKQQILQLDARNKQLRAHLMAEAKELNNLDCSALAHVIDESPLKINRPSQVNLEPAMSAVRKTKIQFAKTESTRNLQLSPVQN